MTRYRLRPDVIATGEFAEYDGTDELLNGRPTGRIILGLGKAGEYLVLNPARLIPVAPPTPAEPEPGAYRIRGVLAVRFPDQPSGTSDWVWSLTAGHDTGSFEEMWYVLGDLVAAIVPESSDRVQPPTVDLPWTYTDEQGDRVEVGFAFAHRTPFISAREDGVKAAVYLDSHEARMGAVAAIQAADRAIGGDE